MDESPWHPPDDDVDPVMAMWAMMNDARRERREAEAIRAAGGDRRRPPTR